ncbi:MAG: DUF5009 domain-containing protein [Mariniphaga sp.]|nr:DUF5009 domain-containing protein [Mariniphaga sp.]
MPSKNRILSIDIMRGLTLFLMLFVNDLYVRGVPSWMGHTKANFDGMGLADWVFPGFLFMVGMSIPFAIKGRLNKGQSKIKVFQHIIIRTLSLLLIGVLMVNVGRLNPELSGISKHLWAVLMYISIFLVWNMYQFKPNLKFLALVLKLVGVAGLIGLAIIFKSGTAENPGWITTGWWGILGLIGWGYFVAALSFLLIGNSIWKTAILWGIFVGLNILSQLGLTGFLNPLKPYIGTILGGNTPSIVLAGLTISLIFQHLNKGSHKKTILIILSLGVGALIAGFVLRNWFIISKIKGTPSWAMVCNGISMILFALIFLIADVWKKTKWAAIFKPAGQNSLTTYLAPDIIYYIIWGFSLPFLFYKQDESQLLAVAGSIGWAVLMVLFAALLSKINIRLKL